MYNQFTEIDQRPLPMKKILLDPMQIPKPGRRRKMKAHSKNPYKIKKVKLLGQEAMREKHVDGFQLLRLLRFEHPKEIIRADISYKRIVEINADHLEFFSNLIELNCSQNQIKLQSLRKLPCVQVINISHNRIRTVPLQLNGFRCLKVLNLSFNYLQWNCIPHLALMPALIHLDLGYNELEEVPEDLSSFEQLTHLGLSGNLFSSQYKAAAFWGALSTIPKLKDLNISRNKMRGIHTQKLTAGNFGTLQILDFSFNNVQNQHNLICARNFSQLKKVIVTGNPFVIANQFKGLEMEIYARTGAQLIIQPVEHYYLKQSKPAKCPIKFEKIVKIDQDNFQRNRNVLFGLQIPKEDQGSSEQSEQQQQKEQEEQAMFVTEQVNVKKGKVVQTPHAEQEEHIMKQSNHSQNSQNSVKSSSSSLKYDDFKKVAAQLLGGDKQYNRPFDINTAYKALKNVVNRVKSD